MTRRAVLALLLFAAPAYAGRTQYGWLPTTDTVPADAIELQTSISELDDLGPYHERATGLAWIPAIGLTDCLELAVPIELVTRTQDDAAPWSGIARYGAELRYRFLRSVPGLHSLARVALSRDVAIQTQLRTEAEIAASYDYARVEVELDLGGVLDVNFSHLHQEVRPGLGASVRVGDHLRIGGELHAELSRDVTSSSWAVVGPDIAWARGRFWLSGVLGVGIHDVTMAPRLNVGMIW